MRRVCVKYRRKNPREAWNVCKSKMEEKVVAVQRLSLLVPAPRSTDVPTSSSSQSDLSKDIDKLDHSENL